MYNLSGIISYYLLNLIRKIRIELIEDAFVRLATLLKSDFFTVQGKKTTVARILNFAFMLTFTEWEVLKREYHPPPHPIPCKTG